MMLKTTLAAIGLAMALATPALADDIATTTPELALPEPDAPAVTVLPHSSVTETEPLALPEPESTPIAPVANCRTGETEYLTN